MLGVSYLAGVGVARLFAAVVDKFFVSEHRSPTLTSCSLTVGKVSSFLSLASVVIDCDFFVGFIENERLCRSVLSRTLLPSAAGAKLGKSRPSHRENSPGRQCLCWTSHDRCAVDD